MALLTIVPQVRNCDTSGLDATKGREKLVSYYAEFSESIKRQFSGTRILHVSTLGVLVDAPDGMVDELAAKCTVLYEY